MKLVSELSLVVAMMWNALVNNKFISSWFTLTSLRFAPEVEEEREEREEREVEREKGGREVD